MKGDNVWMSSQLVHAIRQMTGKWDVGVQSWNACPAQKQKTSYHPTPAFVRWMRKTG